MSVIYLLSGLGADERVFQNLDFKGRPCQFIQWIEPQRHETMAHYASRLSAQIQTANPILIGVSFGGMLAVEMAQQIKCRQVILLSSAKNSHEIPRLYRFFGQIQLHKLLPVALLKWANPLTYWLFGMQTPAEKALLKAILHDTDPVFLKWAIHAIVSWKQKKSPAGILHIHGDRDRILLLQHPSGVDDVVPGGGHLMVLNKSDIINTLLDKALPPV
jgi:pimeloyl-ACP methyl ester carboxylesterase